MFRNGTHQVAHGDDAHERSRRSAQLNGGICPSVWSTAGVRILGLCWMKKPSCGEPYHLFANQVHLWSHSDHEPTQFCADTSWTGVHAAARGVQKSHVPASIATGDHRSPAGRDTLRTPQERLPQVREVGVRERWRQREDGFVARRGPWWNPT